MPRTAALFAVAGTAVLLLLPVAKAETLACQTVNGQTMCMRGSGSMSCQTTNGQTICNQGSGSLSCQTVNKRTVCSTDPNSTPSVKELPQLPSDLKGYLNQEVTVEQDGGKLRVRAGGVDIQID